MQSLHELLIQRTPKIGVTQLLFSINVLVFVAMLFGGAGFWHSPNGIQLNWGANFGPATQDGEWWRLGTAMFLHFGAVHLALNSFALWDAGQLVERMYGHWRFLCIYLVSGLCGNLVSLVVQGNSAVSGGASGAIFGIYGAAFIFLWRERAAISKHEFRWLFGGGLAFSALTIVLGFIIPGIDNAAHIGGFVTGILASIVLSQTITARMMPIKFSAAAVLMMVFATVVLIKLIPAPKYRWSDELLIRSQINEFLSQDQAINRSWLEIMHEGKQGKSSFDALAGKIDNSISEPYEESFERLSKLPQDPALPSAAQLEGLLRYTEKRSEESKAMADRLREQPFSGQTIMNQRQPNSN
ncbi:MULTISPECIES: rhomboid family intramembrane serine protease [Methylotenera]|uniref:rhomboid family intramembrane serine protease n=1 Tax=Methylotenera TaxID=359407 RepID=UPI00037415D1|nr:MULTISPECIES: rhomboid family intramembrane serine protease [Methylotenera]